MLQPSNQIHDCMPSIVGNMSRMKPNKRQKQIPINEDFFPVAIVTERQISLLQNARAKWQTFVFAGTYNGKRGMELNIY